MEESIRAKESGEKYGSFTSFRMTSSIWDGRPIQESTIQYRKFNGQDWQVSILGIGTAELPQDHGLAKEILRAAISGGVNYIDCRYNEPGDEESICRVVGSVIDDTTRVCVNLPVRENISSLDITTFLSERSGWLQRERVDFLSLDGLDRHTWPVVEESGLLARAEQAVVAGDIGALGFSFRDQFLYLRQVIQDSDAWSFGKFEYSFMDDDHLPGTSGLNYAAQQGLAGIAVEPLKHGRLVRNIPDDITALWREGNVNKPASMALAWAWHHPQVSTAVVDVNSLDDVRENLMVADQVKENGLTVREEVLVGRVRDAYRKRRPVPCTTCRACMPCPGDINVPRIFELYNDAVMYADTITATRQYRLEGHNISACDECGNCTRTCGRNIDIPERLREAARVLHIIV